MTRLILGCSWHISSLPTGRKPHCFPPFPRGFPLHWLLTKCSWAPLQAAFSHCSSYLNLSQVAVGQFFLQPHRNAVSGTWFFSSCFLPLLPNLLTLQDRFGWQFFLTADCSTVNVIFPTCQLASSSPWSRACFWHQSCSSQTGFGSTRAWQKPSKANMKPSSSKAVAGMSVAWLGLSTEEESQQPPAGSYSWPHWSLNINIYKSHKRAWCSHLRYGNNHSPLISLLSLLCCCGDVFKEMVSLDWGSNKAQSAIAEPKRVLLLQMSPNHVAFRITKYNSSTFYCAFVTI